MNDKDFVRETDPVAAAPQKTVEHKPLAAGPVVGVIIVIIVLILGGLYFLGQRVAREGFFEPTAEEIQATPDEALNALTEIGTSDEVPAIETDLNATPLENLDAELNSIGKEFSF
ncbi:MAG: hypothetical protein AAB727_00905 [Patescibacteria group bacterium]